MKVCIPVTPDGTVDPRFGRAPRVAVATITDDVLSDWQEFDVHWDVVHDCTGDARRAAQSVVSAPTLGDLDEHR